MDYLEVLNVSNMLNYPIWPDEINAIKDAYWACDIKDWPKCRSALNYYLERNDEVIFRFDLSKWSLRHIYRWPKMLEATGLDGYDRHLLFKNKIEKEINRRVPKLLRAEYKDYFSERLLPGATQMLEDYAKNSPDDQKRWCEIKGLLTGYLKHRQDSKDLQRDNEH